MVRDKWEQQVDCFHKDESGRCPLFFASFHTVIQWKALRNNILNVPETAEKLI